MGTNYYVEMPNLAERIHVGKSSGGWVFSFHAAEGPDGPMIRTVDDWRATIGLLVSRGPGRLVDEYSDEVDAPDLFRKVAAKLVGGHSSVLCATGDGGCAASDGLGGTACHVGHRLWLLERIAAGTAWTDEGCDFYAWEFS